MLSKIKGPAFIFAISFFVGSFVAFNPFDLHFGRNRLPANTQKGYDLTKYEGDSLVRASKARLLNGLQLNEESGVVSIVLGHFLFKSQDDIVKKACEAFQQVELVWMAEGMASSGELPQMKMKAPCRESGNLLQTAPLYIPFLQIMSEAPQDRGFQFESYEGHYWEFSNLTSEWPNTWILMGVHLSGEAEDLQLSSQDIIELMGQPVVIHLK